jgi:hypothetical protein
MVRITTQFHENPHVPRKLYNKLSHINIRSYRNEINESITIIKNLAKSI